jgi:hypothetical protein
LDTSGLKALTSNLESYSLQLKGGSGDADFIHQEEDVDHDSEDGDDSEEIEDDDLDATAAADSSVALIMKPMTRNLDVLKRPVIKNLLVQPAYFQNGLVKAKLSWQVDYNKEASSLTPKSSGSLLASTILIADQPMFTITWFAIKCSTTPSQTLSVTISQRQLPTPITATTINTHFEIYELKYNCDYVVNVRLAAAATAAASTSPQIIQQQQPPQIAPAQFKVPACSQIKIIGRIQPLCYEEPRLRTTTAAPAAFYSIFITEKKITSPLTTTTTTTTTQTTPLYRLPRVYNIRYNIVKKSLHQNSYAVEFSWSTPSLSDHYSGYQISVVPKAIPGFGPISNANIGGSVSALVDRDQLSFVVRQLKPSVKYIFQIQTVNAAAAILGPANSLEFLIENEVDNFSNQNKLLEDNNPSEMLLQMRIKEAIRSSSSSKPIYLSNTAVSGNCSSFSFCLGIVAVFFLIGDGTKS